MIFMYMEQGDRHEARWRNKTENVDWPAGKTMEDRSLARVVRRFICIFNARRVTTIKYR